MRQEQQQQESGANERETPAVIVLPGWRDRSGESERRGERDIEKLVIGLLGPWRDWGQQTWVPVSQKADSARCGCPSPAPPPRGQQNSLPEHAGPAHQAAEARASQQSQTEPASRKDKSPGIFDHIEQEHSPPPFPPLSRGWVQGKGLPPTWEALTVTGIGFIPVLQDGSVQLLPGTAYTFTLQKKKKKKKMLLLR